MNAQTRSRQGTSSLNEPCQSIHRDLPYVNGGGVRQCLDLYLPAPTTVNSSPASPWPVILYIHGGGWWEGAKGEGHHAKTFTEFGYAVAVLNYRYSQTDPFPAQLHDCKSAIRWLRANARKYHLAPRRIIAWGDSAGGHLAAMLGVTSRTKVFDRGDNIRHTSAVQAAICWYGGMDLLTMESDWLEMGLATEHRTYGWAIACLSQLIGGRIYHNRNLAMRASPLQWVRKGAAPMLLVHGTKDDVVPWQQSNRMAEAMREAGNVVELKLIDGAGHGGSQFATPEIFALMRRFLEQVGCGTETATVPPKFAQPSIPR